MKFLRMIPIIFIFYGISSCINPSYAESKSPNEYKVLSSTNKRLSISDVQDYLTKGDQLIKNGDFEKAKQTYDKARNLARQLAGFYRDLNGSFKGLDARIPLEMDKKGRKSIKIWAQSNARLASLYKMKKQPEVAVPLLVETIRLMTPNSPEGKEAYENLLQLGFVNTPYKGF
jgi:tetratricopeptide (TPR) repeat protein